MKKILLLVLISLVFSCVQKNSSDAALRNLKKNFEIGTPETDGIGRIFYTFDTAFENESKIKGCFDQGIGILPQKQKLHKTGTLWGNLLNEYEYETLKEIVLVENHFMNKSDSNKLYIVCKIWITKK